MTWGPFLRVEIAQEFAGLERAEWPVGFGRWMPNRERSENAAANDVPPEVIEAHDREEERRRGIRRREENRTELQAYWRERGRLRREAKRLAKGAA